MKVTFDPEKRADTLRQRGLDFRDAPKVFAGVRCTFEAPCVPGAALYHGRFAGRSNGDRGMDSRCRNRRRGMPPDHFDEEGQWQRTSPLPTATWPRLTPTRFSLRSTRR